MVSFTPDLRAISLRERRIQSAFEKESLMSAPIKLSQGLACGSSSPLSPRYTHPQTEALMGQIGRVNSNVKDITLESGTGLSLPRSLKFASRSSSPTRLLGLPVALAVARAVRKVGMAIWLE